MTKPHGIVTGAGKGIGLSIVKNLLSNGYAVTAITRSANKDLDFLIKAYKGSFNVIYFDLEKIDKVSAFFNKVLKSNSCSSLGTLGR